MSADAILPTDTRIALEELIATSIGLDPLPGLRVEASYASGELRVATTSPQAKPIVGELTTEALRAADVVWSETVSSSTVTDDEQEIVTNLIAFAKSNGPALPQSAWSSRVALAAASRVHSFRVTPDLEQRDGWTMEVGPFRGSGDAEYSALDLLNNMGSSEILAGPHPHCASGPVPAPFELSGFRRVSVQPTGIDSCLQWATVDFFFDQDGAVVGVSMDYWEP